MVCNEVTCRNKDAPPSQPRHAEDAAVEGEDGKFDDTDAPGVDENVGKGYLRESEAAKGALSEEFKRANSNFDGGKDDEIMVLYMRR